MTQDHPFHSLFESFGRQPTAHAEPVNRGAFERLSAVLSVPVDHAGRCVLLRAPRAGHGKTHLLSRVRHHLGGTHEFLPVHAVAGTQVDGASVLGDALRGLSRPLPAGGGLCGMDLVARQLFSLALQGLVGTGEVPCQDRESALAALRLRPVETFDFHHPTAVTAHWARDNFEALGPRLVFELSQATGAPAREVGFWVDWLFRGAVLPPDFPARFAGVAEAAAAGGEGLAMERLSALLALMTLLGRVVLVADDLEVFSMDDGAALRLSAFFGTLRQAVDRLDVLISINDDIWENAFLPRLSVGLADRLSEVVVELEPLGHGEMVALLDSRVPGLGERVLSHVDLARCGGHARGVLQGAAQAWQAALRGDAPAAAAPAVALPEEVPATVEPEVAAPVSEEVMPVALPEIEISSAPAVGADGGWPEPSFEPDVEITRVEPAMPVVDSPPAPAVVDPDERTFQPFDVFSLGEFAAPAPAAPAVEETGFALVSEAHTALEASPFAAVSEAPVAEVDPISVEAPPMAVAEIPAAPEEPLPPAPAFAAAPEPAPPVPKAAVAPVAPASVQPAASESDRVDDLLRQFRERYGRGGL